ncbi:hypothetical protein DV735_g1392, partial [Chaetothyriales sp. CBS 134920]
MSEHLLLESHLADVLPKDWKAQIYHVSTPATVTAPILAPPPGQKEETTLRESHFLAVASASEGTASPAPVFIYAIEILIFTTARLTTIFVSKADSSGFRPKFDAPKTSGSIVQSITHAFLDYLLVPRLGKGKLVLSLFARAQNQYLFAGSIDNAEKHVLDDRQLIKWWCKILDHVWRPYDQSTGPSGKRLDITAHLVVPGCDKVETRVFFPPSTRLDPTASPKWLNSYPGRFVSGDEGLPPRCAVPRLPDDPKSRFLDDLDGDYVGPEGQWRSVKSLDQFWEMMAYRQECHAGRLVGFIWITFQTEGVDMAESILDHSPETVPPTPLHSVSEVASAPEVQHSSPLHDQKRDTAVQGVNSTDLINTITPLHDQKTDTAVQGANSTALIDTITPLVNNATHKGEATLNPQNYDVLMDFLLQLDFTGRDTAAESTRKWTERVIELAAIPIFGQTITGRQTAVENSTGMAAESAQEATVLTGIKKKRKVDPDTSITIPPEQQQPKVLSQHLLNPGCFMCGPDDCHSKPSNALGSSPFACVFFSYLLVAQAIVLRPWLEMAAATAFLALCSLALAANEAATSCSTGPVFIDFHSRAVDGGINYQYGLFSGVGTQSQNQSMWPSLLNNETYLAGTDFCDNSGFELCRNQTHGVFVPAISQSFETQSLQSLDTLDFQTASVEETGIDTLNIFTHYYDPSPPNVTFVPKFPVTVLTNFSSNSSPWFGPAGYLGLGPSSTILNLLHHQGSISTQSFGFYVGTAYDRAGGAANGSLTLGGHDSRRWTEPIYDFPIASVASPTDGSTPFKVTVQSISLINDDNTTLGQLNDSPFDASLSTSQFPLTLPEEATSKFAALSGGTANTNPYDTSFKLPSSFTGSLSIALSTGLIVTIPNSELRNASNTSPISAIPATSNSSAASESPSVPVLGTSFLSHVYLIAQYSSTPPTFHLAPVIPFGRYVQVVPICENSTLSPAAPVKISSFAANGIVGAVIGGVIGGIGLTFAIWWCARRFYMHKAHKEFEASLPAGKAQPPHHNTPAVINGLKVTTAARNSV